MSKVAVPNSLRTWEVRSYTHYSEWRKVVEVMIEAPNLFVDSLERLALSVLEPLVLPLIVLTRLMP